MSVLTAAPITSLGKDISPEMLPATPFRYLLLMTMPLQNWAYRPVSQEGELRPAYAPGALDLVKEFDRFPYHAWVWQRTELSDYFDRGPLLVDVTEQPTLSQHALSHWMPCGGALLIGSGAELHELSDHLKRHVRLMLPDQSEATLEIRPHHLTAWLQALDEDNRERWLGPITSLLWRASWGPMHDWRRLDRTATTFEVSANPLALRSHELSRFDANTREHFLLSRVYEVQAMSSHASRSFAEIRRWMEQLLQVADRLDIHGDTEVEQYIALLAQNLWLLHSEDARTILNDLTESPQARLRQLQALARTKESSHD